MLMQLRDVYLKGNQLVGSLPEAWSNLTSVSPIPELCVSQILCTCICAMPLGHYTDLQSSQ